MDFKQDAPVHDDDNDLLGDEPAAGRRRLEPSMVTSGWWSIARLRGCGTVSGPANWALRRVLVGAKHPPELP